MVDGYFVLAADTAWEVRLVVSSWSARMSLRNWEHILGLPAGVTIRYMLVMWIGPSLMHMLYIGVRVLEPPSEMS